MNGNTALLPADDSGLFKTELQIPFGRFRGSVETCQIRADNDLQAIAVWLADSAADSPHTRANYRKEVERLLMWLAALPEPKAISGLTREDFIAYDWFLADPQPVERWVGKPVPRANPAWRPFTWHRTKKITRGENGEDIVEVALKGGLSEASRRQTFDVLRSLYSYLHNVGYLSVNPLAVKTRRRGGKAQRKSIVRFLDRETWYFLVDFIETLPRETKRDQQHYHRVRWLFYLLYLTFARRAEVAAAKMNDFYRDGRDGLWYWHVMGKGSKEREVPVSAELLAEYIAYRRFNGLPDTPGPRDDTPLVLSITGSSELTPKSVYLIVKEICTRAAHVLKETDPMKADTLEHATTHWLRHTSATHFVDDGGDLRVAQEKLGHGSIQTTMIYQHNEKTSMHEKSSRLKVRK